MNTLHTLFSIVSTANEYMKDHIFELLRKIYEVMTDHRCYARNVSSCAITNSKFDQLPVGCIAQLVEHCTGIAEVMGSNPVQA